LSTLFAQLGFIKPLSAVNIYRPAVDFMAIHLQSVFDCFGASEMNVTKPS
jgi:hypothetical protein